MEEKSTVGMLNCWICGEGSAVVVKTDLRPTLVPELGSLPNEVCSKCKDQAKENDAIWLISVRDGEDAKNEDEIFNPYRSGSLCLVKTAAIERSLIAMMEEGEAKDKMIRILTTSCYLYLDDTTWDALGLPRSDGDESNES